ncbi:hypothetical protein [Legionella oakridgensis]|uniref:Uncharacterized protein n=2 Tax=Legionella oakridgensis TaxID=29423 RepID=W0BD18_9GAMM|nr:hypothetical protein [Legionella oakridgensis]AHE66596.1 hypothetical protein Loa_01040 [Legionella oakridgensis ATCC 33761 = DSM 21215]ETO93684.1 hypothetical protein LOR_56c12550 [Legionella oakridgensis RV-2-2007]KTD37805.1 hypothetical protein Loak_1481 [Legionella oakridgensis]STY19742.1 Uncharacterised protein [Legionella longbeachae]
MANKPNVVKVVAIIVIVLLAAIILHHMFGGRRPVIVPVQPLEPEPETHVQLPSVTEGTQPANTTNTGAGQTQGGRQR